MIMNQSAIDRGLFRSLFMRTYNAKEEKSIRDPSKQELLEIPRREECRGNNYVYIIYVCVWVWVWVCLCLCGVCVCVYVFVVCVCVFVGREGGDDN